MILLEAHVEAKFDRLLRHLGFLRNVNVCGRRIHFSLCWLLRIIISLLRGIIYILAHDFIQFEGIRFRWLLEWREPLLKLAMLAHTRRVLLRLIVVRHFAT